MSLEGTNFNISIKSIDDLARCLSLASLLELAGWPKPGNVHRTRDFENTRFEHFLEELLQSSQILENFVKKFFKSLLRMKRIMKKLKWVSFLRKLQKK